MSQIVEFNRAAALIARRGAEIDRFNAEASADLSEDAEQCQGHAERMAEIEAALEGVAPATAGEAAELLHFALELMVDPVDGVAFEDMEPAQRAAYRAVENVRHWLLREGGQSVA